MLHKIVNQYPLMKPFQVYPRSDLTVPWKSIQYLKQIPGNNKKRNKEKIFMIRRKINVIGTYKIFGLILFHICFENLFFFIISSWECTYRFYAVIWIFNFLKMFEFSDSCFNMQERICRFNLIHGDRDAQVTGTSRDVFYSLRVWYIHVFLPQPTLFE